MLREKQKQTLLKLFRPDDPPFKILLLDSTTQEILSPLLKLSDLRNAGITSLFLVSSARSQIKEISAFYFISSIEGIKKDLAKDLYGEYYLINCFSFKRNEIEELATVAGENQIGLSVRQVYDGFINFIALQDNLFTFNINNSYSGRNVNENLRLNVSGLMSVFCTFNEVPFIVTQNIELGKMLEQKIKNTKVIKTSTKKPLLIILDRDFDVNTPTKHVMGYTELLHDLFNIKLNKIDNISVDTDSEFYKANWHADFPTVAELVDKELNAYRKDLALRSLNEKSDRAQIQAAFENAPQLQRRNEIVNNNLNLCSKILEEVKKRGIDEYYRMQESFDQNELITVTERGTDNDIIRMCVQMLNTKNADLIGPILSKRKIDSRIIDYFISMIKSDEGFGSKVKSFLFKKNLPVYSVVEQILNQVKTQNFDKLSVFDPSHSGIYQSEISKIVVFINGGATYLELKCLNELEKIIKLPIYLGGSEILNADEFIKQVKIDAEID